MLSAGNCDGDHLASESSAVCSAETRRGKTRTPPVVDNEIVIAAAKVLAAIFEDAQATPLGAVIGRQLLKPDHAMRDAVNSLVQHLRR